MVETTLPLPKEGEKRRGWCAFAHSMGELGRTAQGEPVKVQHTPGTAPVITLTKTQIRTITHALDVFDQIAFHGRDGATINGRDYSGAQLLNTANWLKLFVAPQATSAVADSQPQE